VAVSDADGLRIEQFVTGTLTASMPGGAVSLRTSTRYPWSGDVDIEVIDAPPHPWRLSLRIPAWCSGVGVSVSGQPLEERRPAGSIDLLRTWSAGDRVALRMHMEPRIIEPDPRIDALRHTVALERGPLVYAVEDADLPSGASVESLEVDSALDVMAVEAPVPGVDDGMRLAFDARLRDDPVDPTWPYRGRSAGESHVAGARPRRAVPVQTVPYFAWAERPGLGMRVWLPLSPCDDALPRGRAD
jgi:hypothetical protein